ncbi:hypothetical protein GG804_01990 [Sphingomonas histidinilytica]|uniref:hypothetical protein n=1 Tax=Rhizorhabdus histidinilytica TaxID=439228 RepID=UPI001ADA75CE|nr:hypothetical protein [Rhizorhabdus histidinilytica]MBO9375527.1 hypothetical protein [Rhizorhabdus histidinilytica]
MGSTHLETAFTIGVTPDEAALLEECLATAGQIYTGFAAIPLDEMDAARACYAERSEAFKATFPWRDDEENPFASFLALWSDPDFPDFGAHISIADDAGGKGKVAIIQGHEADVSALASLIQKVCKSALPFGFEWTIVSDKSGRDGFGGGYFVITEAGIFGDSTRAIVERTLQTPRAGR